MSQPKPKHQYGKPATWALVQGDILARGEYTILSDVGLRNQMGIEKYGTPLQPGNGRDSILDAYEEAMDLTVYLQNAIQELPPVVPPGKDFRTLTRLYHQAIGIMCALRDYQDDREVIRQEREELEGSVVIHPYQPTEIPVASIPTVWGDVPSQTHEAHTGHPVDFQGITVEVANLMPTIFIPDQVQGKAREDLLEWKANVEASMAAERDRYRKTQEERARAGAESPTNFM